MRLRARWVFSVSSPPIENGVVAVDGDRIAFIGPASETPGPWLDLGEACLLPGLVNAHCHLEFEKSPLPPFEKGGTAGGIFTQWARSLSRPSKPTDPAPRLRRLLETGTTTVADHCGPGTPSFETPFRRLSLWEVLGADRERAEASLKRAEERAATDGGFATPHSLYAVHREVLGKLPFRSVHFLESADEEQFFRRGTGPLMDYVLERGGDVGANLVFARNKGLIIHGNYLNPSEIAALRALEASVIHCPGSHRFFGHKRFPYEELRAAGVRVALGTDSLASNEDLSMLREMRLFRETYPDVGEDEILRMATLEGAAALEMDREIGSIEVGKKADLIAVAGPSSLKDVLKAEQVVFSMIDGKICLNR